VAAAGTRPGWQRWWTAAWNRSTLLGLAAAVLTLLLAGNAWFNPQGMLNRYLNLTGHELPGVTARLTPLKFSFYKGGPKEWQYLSQLGDVMASSLGWPLLAIAVSSRKTARAGIQH
ncbi:MAG: hypothetical protein LAP13_20150, partial [Acidobacteriia bacterium]|nr:hypothetical protein [Terriglobia bacterium]